MNVNDAMFKGDLSSGTVKDTQSGQNFQIELLQYILLKSESEILNLQNYGVSTELKDFGVFDDVIFYDLNYGIFAVQAKWKKKPEGLTFDLLFPITLNSKKTNYNFFVYKYFISFKNIIDKYENPPSPVLKKVAICTNNTLPSGDNIPGSNLYFSKVSDNDFLLKPFTRKRYRFVSSDAGKNEETFNCFKSMFIAYELLLFLTQKKNDFTILRSYIIFLCNTLIDTNTNCFKPEFLNNSSSDLFIKSLSEVLNSLNVQIIESDLESIKNHINPADPNNIPDESQAMDDLLERFLENFELIVGVTTEDFTSEINSLLQKEYRSENVKNIKEIIDSKIMNWLKEQKQGEYLNSAKLQELKNNLKNVMLGTKITDRIVQMFQEHNHLTFRNLNIADFFTNSNLQSRILFCETKPGEILLCSLKSYQILQNRHIDTYLFVQTSGLEDNIKDAIKIFRETTSFQYLVISVDGNEALFQIHQKEIFDIVKNNSEKKAVIIADQQIIPNHLLKDVDHRKQDSVKLTDLTVEAQDKLLEKFVCFQGKYIKFDKIVSNDTKDQLFLNEILTCSAIGERIISNKTYSTSRDYYIPRTLKLENSIVSEKGFLNSPDPFSIVISGAGMGKTSLLNSLAELVKSDNSHCWIVNITLNDHTSYFLEISENLRTFDLTDFLYDCLKISGHNEKILFDDALRKGNIFVVVDGFDEMSPYYTEITLDLIKNLSMQRLKKLIISSRPELEDQLFKTNFTRDLIKVQILPLTKEQQENFVIKLWREKFKKSNKTYDENYLNRFSFMILESVRKDTDGEFVGTPIIIKLIAELYESHAENHLKLEDIDEVTNLFNLLDKLIDEKISINFKEKMGSNTSNPQIRTEMRKKNAMLRQMCQKLSLLKLLTSEELQSIPPSDYEKLDEEEIQTVRTYGLINFDAREFVHKIIAEFFALLYFLEHLLKISEIDIHQSILICFTKVILFEINFQVIRVMFESILKNSSRDFNYNTISTSLKSTESVYDSTKSALFKALDEENLKTVELFLDYLYHYSQSHLTVFRALVSSIKSNSTQLLDVVLRRIPESLSKGILDILGREMLE
jgi:hypothetical protein